MDYDKIDLSVAAEHLVQMFDKYKEMDALIREAFEGHTPLEMSRNLQSLRSTILELADQMKDLSPRVVLFPDQEQTRKVG